MEWYIDRTDDNEWVLGVSVYHRPGHWAIDLELYRWVVLVVLERRDR
jgi:hypothetical protein